MQSGFHGLAREQSCAKNHGGVAGVGAACDRSDRNGSVPDMVSLALVVDLDALVDDLGLQAESLEPDLRGERPVELVLERGERHAVLGAFGTRKAWHDGREIEFEGIGVLDRLVIFGVVYEEAAGAQVGLDQFDLLFAPACRIR